MNNIHKFLFVSFCFFSCTKTYLTEQELRLYVQDDSNGLVKKSSRESFEVICYYQPSDLFLMQNLREAVYSRSATDSLRDSFKSKHFFNFHISDEGTQVETAYFLKPTLHNQLINYLNYDIKNDLLLINSTDTLYPIQTVFVPSFGATTYTSVLMVFEIDSEEMETELELIWNDRFISKSMHSFNYTYKDINAIPNLKF